MKFTLRRQQTLYSLYVKEGIWALAQEFAQTKFGVNKGTFSRAVKWLEELKLIERKQDVIRSYTITEQAVELLQEKGWINASGTQIEVKERRYFRIRAHNLLFRYTFEVPLPLNYYEKLSKLHFLYEVSDELKNVHYVKGEIAGATVRIFRKHILVRLKDVYAETTEEALEKVQDKLLEIKQKIEEFTKRKLGRGELRRVAKARTQEWAMQYHPLAQLSPISVRTKYWEIDKSKDVPELEARHSLLAPEHVLQEIDDYDFRAETGYSFRDAVSDIQALKQQVVGVNEHLLVEFENVLEQKLNGNYNNTQQVVTVIKEELAPVKQAIEMIAQAIQNQTELMNVHLSKSNEILYSINEMSDYLADGINASYTRFSEQFDYRFERVEEKIEQTKEELKEEIRSMRRNAMTKYERFLEFVRSHPGEEFTSRSLAEALQYPIAECSMYMKRVRNSRLPGFRSWREGRHWNIRFEGG